MDVTEVVTLMEGHVMEVASLKEGEWFCYSLFNGGGLVMLRRWTV